MKNKFFTTILFLVSSTAVMAQETGMLRKPQKRFLK